MGIRTTTYLCRSDRCYTCGSVRISRGVGEYKKHDDGSERLINCSDCHRSITCECGKVYPLSESKKLSPYQVNGIAKGCTACMKERHQRELAKATARCRLTLARHIAKARRKRVISRDIAVRYLQRFGGKTFSVQTGIDTAEIYLENAKGQIIGSVSYLDKYPKAPVTDFSDIPY